MKVTYRRLALTYVLLFGYLAQNLAAPIAMAADTPAPAVSSQTGAAATSGSTGPSASQEILPVVTLSSSGNASSVPVSQAPTPVAGGPAPVLSVSSDPSPFQLLSGPVSDDQKTRWGKLKPAEQEAFQKRRVWILGKVARLMTSSRLAFGFGSVVRRLMRIAPASNVNPLDPSSQVASESAATPAPTPLSQLSKHDRVQEFLLALDQQLWESAPMIASVNEFGINMASGINGGAMIKSKGLYITGAFGLSLGINLEHKAIVFDLFAARGSVQEAFSRFGLSAMARVALFGRHRDFDAPLKNNEIDVVGGSVPFLGFPSVTLSKGGSTVGVAKGISLFPGVGELVNYAALAKEMTKVAALASAPGMLGWRNHIHRASLLRVTISRSLPHLIRFETATGIPDGVKKALKMAGSPVMVLARFVASRFRRGPSGDCGDSLGSIEALSPVPLLYSREFLPA